MSSSCNRYNGQYTPLTDEQKQNIPFYDSNTSYYSVELPPGTRAIHNAYDRHTERTTIQHILLDGKLLNEIRAESFAYAPDYRTSYFNVSSG